MKKFLSIFFSFLFAFQAHAGFVLERIDGTIWDQVERLRVPNNQITKLADKRYRLETGNENVLNNPNFQAAVVGEGWIVNTANLDSAIFDNTLAFEGAGSLQLDLKQGNYTDLELISQTFPAGYKLGGADLEAFIRIAKSSLNPAVQLKWCAHVDGVLANCVTVPSAPADTYFQKFLIAFASKPAFATAYKVGLYATYNVASGVVGILNLATAVLQPYQGKGTGTITAEWPCTLVALSSTGTLTSSTTAQCQRIGGNLYIVGETKITGTSAFSGVQFSPPGSLSIDYNRLTANAGYGGSARLRDVGSGNFAGKVRIISGNIFDVVLDYSTGGAGTPISEGIISNTSPFPIAINDTYNFNVTLPIKEWSQSTATVTPDNSINMIGSALIGNWPTCPTNTVGTGTTITRSQYPALFQAWQIPAGTDSYVVPNWAGIGVRGVGSQTYGGETYTATLGQKRNDAMASHTHAVSRMRWGNTSTMSPNSLQGGSISPSHSSSDINPGDVSTGGSGSGTETHGPDIAQTVCYVAVANPILPISGMVISNSQSSERIERARFSCQTSSVVNNQSTGFIASIGNAVDAGTYRTCTVAFNTPFASQPECPASTVLGTGTLPSGYTVALLNITTSGFTLVGPDSDFFASVVCMGPR